MLPKNIGYAAAALAAAGAVALGGAALASAEDAPSTTTSAAANGGTSLSAPDAATGDSSGQSGQSGQAGPGGPGGGSQDTPVTGSEKTKIEAAVKAKDAKITITEVRMDPDGSYDVLGTSGGNPVFYEVSKDLATITLNDGGPGGGHGGTQGQPPSGTTSSDPADANGSAT